MVVEEIPDVFYLPVGLGPSIVSAFFFAFLSDGKCTTTGLGVDTYPSEYGIVPTKYCSFGCERKQGSRDFSAITGCAIRDFMQGLGVGAISI